MPTGKETNTILIPGKETLRRTVVPPIDIQLPITASVRPMMNIAIGSFFLIFSVVCILSVVRFFPGEEQPILVALMLLAVQMGYLLLMAISLAVALRAFTDAAHKGDVLRVDGMELWDRRSGVRVAWTDVTVARPIILPKFGLWGVALQLRDPALLPASRLRRGYPLAYREPNEIHCQTKLLTESSYELAYSILTLVKLSGGMIQPQHGAIFGTAPPTIVPQ